MVVEFRAVTAIDSLVELLKVAENQAVHCYEQEEPFHPGLFPGLILLARFASQRAGEEFKQAIMAAEKNRLNTNLQGECDELRWQLAQVTAERDAERERVETLRRECKEERDRMQRDHETENKENLRMLEERMAERDKAIQIANGWEGLAKRRGESLLSTQGILDEALAERDAARKQVAELSGNSGKLPAEPAPKPYQWQVGDRIVRSGSLRSVLETRERSVRPEGWEEDEFVSQEFLEECGWKLYRKASDLGVQQLTPRQVEISDSTGTDGKGQL